jgi:hypothetical protein
MLQFALVRSKLEYAWNSVTITDFNKLERIRRQFATLCRNRFCQDVGHRYDNLLERLNFPILHSMRHYSIALFLINIFIGTKCCPSALETVGIRVRTRNIRVHMLF